MKKVNLKRKTFAIISHPDAGKTTLTEKLLLYGGAIQLAGQVRAKGEARRSRSDFMKMEKERGISVSTSAMSFEFENNWLNIVDTPGHEDFSEDTYRTITAVDSSIMLIDGAKGVESQTKKLFEICRLREVPILTFCNKMDQESRNNLEILEEIQDSLAIDVVPMNWPIGEGKNFIGCYCFEKKIIKVIEKKEKNILTKKNQFYKFKDDELKDLVDKDTLSQSLEEIEMVEKLLPKFDIQAFLAGNMTPIWFGSAINSFGVTDLLNGILTYSPSPNIQKAKPRNVKYDEKKVTGFVFKIQANLDNKHRDRIAFVRICSGHFKRGMKLTHVRTSKVLSISSPLMFLANQREITDDAVAGDIIGIPNHGLLKLGDTLSEGEKIQFTNLPTFSPELLKTVRCLDPLKSKHLEKALNEFAEEGISKLFKPITNNDWIIGVVGSLQFDVLKSRLENEYDLNIQFKNTNFSFSRWIEGDKKLISSIIRNYNSFIALDSDNDPVFLFRIQWDLDKIREEFPNIKFNKIKESKSTI